MSKQLRKNNGGHMSTLFILALWAIIGSLLTGVLAEAGYELSSKIVLVIFSVPIILLLGVCLFFVFFCHGMEFLIWIGRKRKWKWVTRFDDILSDKETPNELD